MKKMLLFCILLLAVAALPVLAERPIDRVPAGLDYWQTLSSGATMYDFSDNAIPAGFFCGNSKAFKGRVNFEGVPIITQPASILGTTDTVIERLDDAVFDDSGTAQTRIRGRVLNLQATDLLRTSCGSFKVTANLTGNQPVSPMTFHSLNKFGGTFDAQLRLRVRINFTNVKTNKAFAVVRDIYLPSVNDTPFAIGKDVATACLSSGTLDPTTVTLADGSPLLSRQPITGQGLVTGTPTGPVSPAPEPTPVATGCQCNSAGQCLPTYAWHTPCAPGEDYDRCEKHFTHTPCELGYTSQCTKSVVQQSYLGQLKELHSRGLLIDTPEVALQQQTRSADQITRDQAAHDRQQAKQQ